MQHSVDSISDALRGILGQPPVPVSPDALAKWLKLEKFPVSFGRSGLHGNQLHYDDTVPREVQAYQIARAACACALYRLGLIHLISPHDLAVKLCGVTSFTGARAIPPVTYLAAVRARRSKRVANANG